ncbi:MFS transporter [Nisaea acidiphila]|uniref:MFS transporter n=1 Tax=Nisaea acidiphila TaxID=1862145 RepID=A0A9J7ARP1_9PROT|nr:MFS transporter [Nisaea acidiphila]UUX47981.1 MFS transporter [Nisaea acidiphila]
MSAPEAGQPGGRRAAMSWCLFDWANSPLPTVIITFVFSAYFARGVVGDEVEGTVLWSRALTIAGLAVAILAPVLGAIADRSGPKKPWIAGFSLLAILAAGALWYVHPDPGDTLLALVAVGLVLIGTEFANIFYNAMLGGIAPPGKLGRIGGWGWALGYLGAIVCLLIALLGFVQAETPPFGLDKAEAEHVRATALLAAGWFVIFSLPLLLWVPDDEHTPAPLLQAAREGLGTLWRTLCSLRHHRDIWIFLIARMLYADGLATLFQFGGLYAAGTFGMSFAEIIQFGIALNVTAGIGAFLFAWIDDWIGPKPTIAISLVGLIGFGIAVLVVEEVAWFWIFALALGIFVGPSQAASRTLLTQMAPEAARAQMFGLYALSGKATSFLGPALLGWATVAFDSQRWGMATILLFWIAGLALLAFVRPASPHGPAA